MPKFNRATAMVEFVNERIRCLAHEAAVPRGTVLEVVAGRSDCSIHYLRKMVARPEAANPSVRVLDGLLDALDGLTPAKLKGGSS